ncbi:MAG TPA: hypothetical protein VFY10_08800 [Dehalococcoidia bacterium]|nr:hypothetical protein [Dehalococcoidia bacterium]
MIGRANPRPDDDGAGKSIRVNGGHAGDEEKAMQDPRRRQQAGRITIPEVRPQAQPEQPRQARQSNRPSRRKIGGSLLALSAAAVVSVYTIGYVNTQSSTDQLPAAAANTPVAAATSSTSPRTSATSPQSQIQTQPQSSAPAPAATPAPSGGSSPSNTQSAYRDGTYTGVGNSRHGGIAVSVVISGGKIASTSITQCGTRYSCAYVQPLMQLVVDRQAVPVNHVSGATDSSTAFKGAISQALQKALAGG